MISHAVCALLPDDEPPARTEQLAWRLAQLATDPAARRTPQPDVADMVANRLTDDVAVAAASLTRAPVAAARAQALAHVRLTSAGASGSPAGRGGAAVLGLPLAAPGVDVEWAAWANAVAVRELDFHDTYLAAEYAHPGDTIPPLLAVAQSTGADGDALMRGIVTAYEVHVGLARSISLHAHGIDHVAHLAPAVAAGIGTLLGLDTATVFQAINQAVHIATATRQSRAGSISTWKAYAPAFAGKAAIEAVDRAMRGQSSPEPIYEGVDGVIARLLDGPGATYAVELPGPDEPRRAIMDTFTKEHSAEYQAQAFIDLARALHAEFPWLADPDNVAGVTVYTSHHTHVVIGSGSGPHKYDPAATRETLDHSLPYVFAVALQDGQWHHERSYAPERAARPDTVDLWQRIRTVEDPQWTARYHAGDPGMSTSPDGNGAGALTARDKAFGGRVEIELSDGGRIVRQIDVADAHPLGARPFGRAQYEAKFRALTAGLLADGEAERFGRLVERWASHPADLTPDGVDGLTVVAAPDLLADSDAATPAGLL